MSSYVADFFGLQCEQKYFYLRRRRCKNCPLCARPCHMRSYTLFCLVIWWFVVYECDRSEYIYEYIHQKNSLFCYMYMTRISFMSAEPLTTMAPWSKAHTVSQISNTEVVVSNDIRGHVRISVFSLSLCYRVPVEGLLWTDFLPKEYYQVFVIL
jgi:hypothetical protein